MTGMVKIFNLSWVQRAFQSDMYRLSYPVAFLLASFVLSHARHTVFISHSGEHSYLPNSIEPDVCMTPECVIAASGILTSVDETVNPCDDFQRFACGGWLKRHEVSEDQPEINLMVEMQNSLNRKLRELLESKYESSDPLFVKMLKDSYKTCMDLDSIEKAGSEPLKRILSQLGGWPVIEGNNWDESTFDWVNTLISLQKIGLEYNLLMGLDVDFESINETVHIIHLGSPYNVLPRGSNLTLGLNDTKISAHFKRMVKAAKLLGIDENTAEQELLEVLHFAIALENSTVNPEELDESPSIEKQIRYHTVNELEQKVPQIPWLKYLNGMINKEVYEDDIVLISNLDFFIKLVDLTTSTEKRVIANYIMMRVVLQSSEYLSKEWNNINQALEELYGKRSAKKRSPQWKPCLSFVMNGMEKALSSYYVRHYFADENKDEAMILMKYIHKEFLKILEETEWMDEKTREKAEEKANALKTYIGYPKELLNDTFVMKMYENLTITTNSHLENVLAFRKRTIDERFAKLRMPKQLDNKFEDIVQVNAFYDPEDNSIGIPAGILHDAFFEKNRPNYLNFGAIGFVIGHEITHGFDNEGRHFDKDGKEVSWWDKDSDEHFRKKVQCIIDQYDNYTTDIGLKVNGEKTQNENIADNGGLKEAYLAYQSWTKDNGIEPMLPGLKYTQNQLFWLSAAHVWCSKNEPERLKLKLLWDPHSPGRYRIIGPMSNLEEFSKDFNCSADSPMNRKYKCKVW